MDESTQREFITDQAQGIAKKACHCVMQPSTSLQAVEGVLANAAYSDDKADGWYVH